VGKGVKVNVEYVSANPTGALHLGHARGAAIGDSLTRILKKASYDVTREYYVNDAGNQINNLARSLQVRYLEECGQKGLELPENGYHGKDIIAFAKVIKEKYGEKYVEDNEENFEFFKDEGSKIALEKIVSDLHDFRVDFDVFTSEKAIRKAHKVDEVVKELKPFCYESEGALFLNTTKDGDDKDRVIVKSDGSYTYLLPDIAYHKDKFDRGFDKLIDLFGADHHGYIARIKSSMKSLGYNPDNLEVKLVQMVRLFKDGAEYKMSKRTGNAVSMKELIEEVGVDAVRYFFNSRASSQHLDFDLDLAKTMGSTNPVYYCQYAHARLSTLISMGKDQGFDIDVSGNGLVDDSEIALMKSLAEYKKVVEDAALSYSPHKITIYVRKLASDVNDFYTRCRVLDKENKEITSARLGLCLASKIVLQDGLSLLGVNAPDHM
ncbi:MAG: arginine--tRNA ligase, partial [Bacilli bacterium]|nr:arginine--tRNA ligase [Bacilli bacterium]